MQNATPWKGDMNAFLKEALATALQGNKELRMILEQHESVAHEAATKIDEIVLEHDGIMANTRDLTAQFREMQKKYRGRGQISLSSLASLKEHIGAKQHCQSRDGLTRHLCYNSTQRSILIWDKSATNYPSDTPDSTESTTHTTSSGWPGSTRWSRSSSRALDASTTCHIKPCTTPPST